MTERITPRQFHEADGVEDWRALALGACAHFRSGSFATGVALVSAIGGLAAATGHCPDVDLRHEGVTVRLRTAEAGGLSARDIRMAREISAAARELGMEADPAVVQDFDLTIDARATADVRPFWCAVLGYEEVGDDDLRDPSRRWASLWFQRMTEPRPDRNRVHVDVFVPHDQAETRVAAALAAGGILVSDGHAPAWWTLADPEGNEVDVATWVGRDDPAEPGDPAG